VSCGVTEYGSQFIPPKNSQKQNHHEESKIFGTLVVQQIAGLATNLSRSYSEAAVDTVE